MSSEAPFFCRCGGYTSVEVADIKKTNTTLQCSAENWNGKSFWICLKTEGIWTALGEAWISKSTSCCCSPALLITALGPTMNHGARYLGGGACADALIIDKKLSSGVLGEDSAAAYACTDPRSSSDTRPRWSPAAAEELELLQGLQSVGRNFL